MELSDSKIKKFLIFSQKSPPHFSTQTRKKKIHPEKIRYISKNGAS